MAEQIRFRANELFFFTVAFGWSLVFWFITVVLGGINQFPGSILQYFGGAGPLVAALIITLFFEQSIAQRDFWSRTFSFRRMSWQWALIAMLIHPSILLIAIAVDGALGAELVFQTTNLNSPWAVIRLVVFVFIFGPLPEEMGWRGIGYERLRKKMNPLVASLVLGIAWATWHIPLFLIEGTFQNELGFGGVRFWVFLASNIPLTIIITWVYSHTKRSTLSAVLVHFSGNIVGAVVAKSDRLALLELIGLAIVASLLIARTGTDLGNVSQSHSPGARSQDN